MILQNWTANTTASENCTVLASYVFKTNFTYKDKEYLAGQRSAVLTYEIKTIDKKAPTINIASGEKNVRIINDATSASSVNVGVEETGSGIKTFTYTKDGVGPITVSNTTITLTETGVYTFTATDNANNTETKSITIYPKPRLTSTPAVTNGGVYNTDIIIGTIVGTETTTTTLKINGKEEAVPYQTNVAENSLQAYTAEVSDGFGGTDTLNFTVNKIVPDAPTISVDPDNSTYTKVGTYITINAPAYTPKGDYRTTVVKYKIGDNGEEKVFAKYTLNGAIESYGSDVETLEDGTHAFLLEGNGKVIAWYDAVSSGLTTSSATRIYEVTNFDDVVSPEDTAS